MRTPTACFRDPVPSSLVTRPSLDKPPVYRGTSALTTCKKRVAHKWWPTLNNITMSFYGKGARSLPALCPLDWPSLCNATHPSRSSLHAVWSPTLLTFTFTVANLLKVKVRIKCSTKLKICRRFFSLRRAQFHNCEFFIVFFGWCRFGPLSGFGGLGLWMFLRMIWVREPV